MITEATFDDIPQLCELLGLLFAQESDFAPDHSKQTAGLRLAIGSPDYGRIFVMRRDSLLVGMINLLTVVSATQGGLAVLLEDIIVRPEFRGQGIATSLLGHAFEFACVIGAVQATLLTEATNRSAIRLYRKPGFACSGGKPKRLSLGI